MAEIKCDLAVIGTGAAGLVAGTVAAGLGFKVCTVEKDRIGEECTWTGAFHRRHSCTLLRSHGNCATDRGEAWRQRWGRLTCRG